MRSGRVDIDAAKPQSPTRIDCCPTMRKTLLVLVFCGLAACERPPPLEDATPPPIPAPTPTPDEGYKDQLEEPSTSSPSVGESEPAGDVEAPAEVNMDAADAENRLVKAEVLARIDVVTVGPAEVAALEEKLKLPQIQKFAEDPTVVFVVLGFADKKGDEKKNLAISLQRADSVVKTLKDRGAIMNVTHAVGMGSSDMFDAKDLDKNRVVEVWAVLP